MDKRIARQLHHLLAPLGAHPWHRATFLADASGQILHQFGVAEALKQVGEEVTNVARKEDAEESLYMSALGEGLFVGVLFDADQDVDDVRDAIAVLMPSLLEVVS